MDRDYEEEGELGARRSIRDFFGSLSHEWLIKFVEHRIADRRILRLIKKWLRAGVSEDGGWSKTEAGTPQGSVISPMLANIYLITLSTSGYNTGGRIGPRAKLSWSAMRTTQC